VNNPIDPRQPVEQLRWNAGGWFGAQIGSTVWILVSAFLAVVQEPATGALLFGLFLLPSIIGTVLWKRRFLSCYASMQYLLLAILISGLFAIYLLDGAKIFESIQTGASIPARSAYFTLSTVIVMLMVLFFIRFGRAGDKGD